MIKRTIAKLSNKARIKKLFKILNGQNEKFLHFFGISTPTVKDVDEQILEEKYRNFMQDIEKNGLIDYFLQNMNNNVENADVYKFCLTLCKHISNKSIVKKIIEDMIYSSAVDEVVALIKATEDPEYIKEKWLEDVKKMHALGIYGDRAVALIKATGDPEYIKECLENVEKMQALYINGDRAVALIKATEDPEYIKECLENVEKMQALYINGDRAVNLIKETGDSEYIKEKWLENVKKMQALGIEGRNAVILIKATKDIEYIKKLLKNKEKTKALNIQDFHAIELIRTVEEKEPGYIKEYIKNHIKNRKINELESTFLAQVIIMTGDAEFIDYCENSDVLNHETREILDRFTKMPPVTLPDKMTIGIEIESEGLASREEIAGIIGNLSWKLKPDDTLDDGIEAVPSSGLTPSTAGDEIYGACKALCLSGQTISERCGGHIHIGADYLTDLQDWKNLRTIWNDTEKILYIISNRKGEIPRKGVLVYARPISGNDESKQETINLENESDLEKFIVGTKIIQGTRYSGINYCNVGRKEKNTIEFRLPNGTLDPTTWIENINLFGGLVRVSHELSKIMLKSEEQRTEEEKKMLYNYEVIQMEQDERKVAEALIGLCVSQEQMQTYLDRYDENSELLEKTPELNDRLNGLIRKNKIGQKTIPTIGGEDFEEFSRKVSKELEIIKEREGEGIGVK